MSWKKASIFYKAFNVFKIEWLFSYNALKIVFYYDMITCLILMLRINTIFIIFSIGVGGRIHEIIMLEYETFKKEIKFYARFLYTSKIMLVYNVVAELYVLVATNECIKWVG